MSYSPPIPCLIEKPGSGGGIIYRGWLLDVIYDHDVEDERAIVIASVPQGAGDPDRGELMVVALA